MLRAGSQRSSTRYCTVSSDMRKNRNCRLCRPIKLLNRSGLSIQNLNASDQNLVGRSTTDRKRAYRLSFAFTAIELGVASGRGAEAPPAGLPPLGLPSLTQTGGRPSLAEAAFKL